MNGIHFKYKAVFWSANISFVKNHSTDCLLIAIKVEIQDRFSVKLESCFCL